MVQKIKQISQLAFIFFLFPIICNGGQMGDRAEQYKKLGDVPDAVWQKLSTKKIYFGHQSVGYNILDGVRALLQENPQIKLTIEKTKDPRSFREGTIAHSDIGQNGDPESKLQMFESLSKAGGAEMADIMFFKFCYVDFNNNTNINALFNDYKKAFAYLRNNYPHTIFIHLSVPLTTVQGGLKGWVKKVIGRPLTGAMRNVKRCEFNELLRTTYQGKEPFLDIAAAESTFPDGRRATFQHEGKTYYYLVPEYTKDGGHLNQKAGKIVAEQLLLTLAGTVQ